MNKNVKIYKFSEIATFSQGIQVDIDNQYDEPFEGSVQFLRIVDFVTKNEPPRYIKKPDDKYIKTQGELIMIRYGASAAGKVFSDKSGAIANNMFKINITSSDVNPEYLKYYLSQNKIYNLLNGATGKSTMPAVNFKFLSKLEIPVPSLDEQAKIVKNASKFLELEQELEQELELRKEQTEYYFSKMFDFGDCSK